MINRYWIMSMCVLLTACSSGSGTPPDPASAPVLSYATTEASGDLTAENTATLSWAAADFSKPRYEVLRTSQSDCPVETAAESCANYKLLKTEETTVQDTNLPWGEKYYYYLRVGATDHALTSKYSPVAEVIVPVIAPRIVQLTMSGTTASLTWDHLPDVNYSVLISHESDCDVDNISMCEGGIEIDEENAESLQRLLDVGKDYYFWIKAKRNAYTDVTKEPVNKFVDPFSPSVVSIEQQGRDLGIVWDEDRNTTYTVLRWNDCLEAPSLTAYADADDSVEERCTAPSKYEGIIKEPPYIDTKVTPGTVYYYAVQANAGGKTAKRSTLVKGVLNAPLPTDFNVEVKGSSSVITFTKDAQFPSIEYAFYRSSDLNCSIRTDFSGCDDNQVKENITSGHIDDGLKGNRSYGYWLEASIGDAKSISSVKEISTGSVLVDVTADRSFTTVNDGQCVLENESGLRWAILLPVDDIVSGKLLDADDQFELNKLTKTGESNGLCGDGVQVADSCTTADIIGRFNSAKICGKDNWRLPTLTELMSVVNYQDSNIDKTSFYEELKPSVRTFKYWTADKNKEATQAIALAEKDGTFSYHSTSDPLKVRLVSTGASDE